MILCEVLFSARCLKRRTLVRDQCLRRGSCSMPSTKVIAVSQITFLFFEKDPLSLLCLSALASKAVYLVRFPQSGYCGAGARLPNKSMNLAELWCNSWCVLTKMVDGLRQNVVSLFGARMVWDEVAWLRSPLFLCASRTQHLMNCSPAASLRWIRSMSGLVCQWRLTAASAEPGAL